MDVHVDVSLCRVIVTQIVTQLGDHPLRMDQREILGATRTARCSPTSPVQAAYCRSRPSRRASGARSRIPYRVTHRSPWGAPSRLQCVRGRPSRRRARRVRAACLLRDCRCPLTMPGTSRRSFPDVRYCDRATRRHARRMVSGTRVRNRSGSPHSVGTLRELAAGGYGAR